MTTNATSFDRGFHDLDAAAADPAQRAILDATRAQFGGVPPAVSRMAIAPAMFHAFIAATEAFEATSFTAVERETVILVLAREFGCEICIAMHTAIAARLGAPMIAEQVLAGRTAALADPRLDVLARFTEAVLDRRGDVGPAAWHAFLAAGYSRTHALELLVGVGAYTMSTFANRMTGAPLR